jgi:phosphoribosylamine--glycine ligase
VQRRLGDPEAQVILPRLAGALGPLLAAAAARAGAGLGAAGRSCRRGRGHRARREGYPGRRARAPIEASRPRRPGALVFHAGTSAAAGRLRHERRPGAHGRRARRGPRGGASRAERRADAISWDGMQRRHDIAADLPARRRRGAAA